MQLFNIDRFGGRNDIDPKHDLFPEEATNLINVRLTRESIYIRPGTVEVGTGLGVEVVRRMQEISGVLLVTQGNNVKKLVGSTWVASGLTGLNTSALSSFVEFPTTDTGAAVDSGTVTSASENGYSIADTGKTFTENAYVDKYLKITSGAGSGQIRLIVANSATEIFVVEPFSIIPAATHTYEVINKVDANYFFNGVDQPKKNLSIASTTWTNIPNIQFKSKYFKFAVIYNNRIVAALPNDSDIYVSTLLNGEDFPYRITVGKGNNSIVKGLGVVGNQLVVHKGMEGGTFISEFIDPVKAEFIQRSETFGAVNFESIGIGENIMFFVSERGIEWFNPLETDMLEGHKSLSDNKISRLRDGTFDNENSQGVTFDAKYFAILKDATTPNLANNRVFIFDTALYLQRRSAGKQRAMVFLEDQGHPVDSIAVHDGELYFGGTGKVYKYGGVTDDGNAINSFWEKDGIDLKVSEKSKSLRKLHILSAEGTSSDILDVTVSTEKESKSLESLTLDKINLSGKRVKGREFKIKLDLSSTNAKKVDNIKLIFELGKF